MIDASKVAGAFVRKDDGTYELDQRVGAVLDAMRFYGVPKLHNTGIRILIQRMALANALGTNGYQVDTQDVRDCFGLADDEIEQVSSNQFSLKQISYFNAKIEDEEEQRRAA